MITFLPLFIALPLAMAFFIPLIGHTCRFLPSFVGIITTACLLVFSLLALGGNTVYHLGGWAAPLGIPLVLDGVSGLFLALINIVGFLSAVYSAEYIGKLYTSKLRYYTLFLLLIAGINGVVLSGDLFTTYIFLEIASISLYALVGFGCEARQLEASFKYLVMGTVASSFILLGIAFVYSSTGNLNLAVLARVFAEQGLTHELRFALVLILTGFFIKTGVVPFHSWLPDAHPSAPAPVSAMLSGVVIKSLGIYVLLRLVFNVFGFTPLLSRVFVYAGLLSIMVGGIMAMRQTDFKRLLGYSTVSQLGFILLGFGIGTPLGILGGLFHLVNHAFFKSLLFLDAGAVEYAVGTRDLNKLGRLSEKMPVTSFSTLVGAFSLSGVPPFGGFWSKLIIIFAAVQAGYAGAACWAVAGSFLSIAYCTRFLNKGFFGTGKDFDRPRWESAREVPAAMMISLVVLALLCIGAGLLIRNGFDGLLGSAAHELFNGCTGYVDKVIGN